MRKETADRAAILAALDVDLPRPKLPFFYRLGVLLVAVVMVLLPLIRSQVDVPIIAAGGMLDGATMAAAFVLGAEGVQMGTRMVSAAESPVHENWKNAIVAAKETDTIFLNRRFGPGLRVLRTEKSEALEYSDQNAMSELGHASELYFGGDMNASIALTGQVAGRIGSIRPVADVIRETAKEFFQVLQGIADSHLKAGAAPGR